MEEENLMAQKKRLVTYLVSPTGTRFRMTIATTKFLMGAVRRTPEKIFFVIHPKNGPRAYICYNTEFHLPDGWTKTRGE